MITVTRATVTTFVDDEDAIDPAAHSVGTDRGKRVGGGLGELART
jgi:hypothetical protein